MSIQCLVAKCKSCEERYDKSSKDANNPYGDDGSSFCLILEWKNKDEIMSEVLAKSCPKCNGNDWYLTDRVGS